jgi:hypothetical protein
MANELSLQGLTISFTKANVPSVEFTVGSLSITVSGTQLMDNVQSIGFAAEEAILMGDVAAGGWCFFQNMDATNFVELRSGTGATDFVRLNAGEIALFRMSADATAPYAIADTAAVNLRCLRFDA